MGLASGFYNAIARRNSVFATTIFASAFAFSIGFDQAINAYWENRNKGKLWKDIRSRYVEQDSDE
ncbi:ubiquinol-cytochrome C reductase UQCRX/QCR9-like protein [Rhizoctonia solani]|uniref:Complex III subunit 9 n=1 Tax=Rhizoctonia solani TaxID=456999 RepID=A0A8H8NTF1_9AGAM|nr:ubiquinol-cytochrome C reductase UQCRX/QCR9-like protein [Rhizoctonia solani]QRW19711.1 ubiquinol-cytochrome C reductase UQCRX/QCR9-like protein [Rhizoctonia solani]